MLEGLECRHSVFRVDDHQFTNEVDHFGKRWTVLVALKFEPKAENVVDFYRLVIFEGRRARTYEVHHAAQGPGIYLEIVVLLIPCFWR